MPTVTLSKKELESLVGKKLPLEQLKDRISMLGTDLEGIEGDEIQVEIFPNRPDMLSTQGFARAFSTFIGTKSGLVEYNVTKSKDSVICDKSLPSQWPYAAACIVKGLQLDENKVRDIIQLQEKLGVTMLRRRKKGGIGLYPLEMISFPVRFEGRKAQDINFVPLGMQDEMSATEILEKHPKGVEYKHICDSWKKLPVFVDAKGNIMSMPPIINSELMGKITSQTTNVFVECTGNDLEAVQKSLIILVTALADMGGEVISLHNTLQDGKSFDFPNLKPTVMPIDREEINTRLGLKLSESDCKTLLSKMGFGYKNKEVLVPAYRADILHNVDFAEDIAIAYGYENFEATIPRVATIASQNPLTKWSNLIRERLIGLGLLEVKNFHLISQVDLIEKSLDNQDAITLLNSLGDHNTLRTSIIASLLKTYSTNQHNEFPQNIFEIGRVFHKDPLQATGVKETRTLGVGLCHDKVDFTQARQVLDLLARELGIEIVVKEAKDQRFIPGRVAQILLGKQVIGVLGECHPQVLENWGIAVPVALLELNIEALFAAISQ